MMTDKLYCGLVTADDEFLATFKERLSREVDLAVFRTASECQSALATRRPDCLMIDGRLPEDAGFALHRALRDDFETADLFQLVFCEGADLARPGFDPDDQLLHPIAPDLFWRKLDQLRKTFAHEAAAKAQMAYAQSVALTAMSSMGELGVVMQFLSRSFACQNIQSVAALALDALRQYELAGCLDLIWEGDQLVLNTDGSDVDAATRELIAQRRTLGRLLEIGDSLIVNFPHVSILVTDLPADDGQRRGRIRDNIATLAEGVESRIQGLLLEHNNLLKQQGIRYAVWEIRDSVRNLDARQVADLALSRELVSGIIDDFEEAFLHMGMTQELENALIGQLVDLRQRIGEIVGRPGEVHQKLQTVVGALETLAGEVAGGDG